MSIYSVWSKLILVMMIACGVIAVVNAYHPNPFFTDPNGDSRVESFIGISNCQNPVVNVSYLAVDNSIHAIKVSHSVTELRDIHGRVLTIPYPTDKVQCDLFSLIGVQH